jgi:antitoxin ParD1/3/4
MDITLTPDLAKLVKQKIESGMYNSASEVVREGLRLLKEQDELKKVRLEELRRDVLQGYEQAQRGESAPLSRRAPAGGIVSGGGTRHPAGTPGLERHLGLRRGEQRRTSRQAAQSDPRKIVSHWPTSLRWAAPATGCW